MTTHANDTWELYVSLPFEDIAEFLKDAEYEKTKGIFHKDVTVTLVFQHVHADMSVGINEHMSYEDEWSCSDEYPTALKSAISKYLASIDVEGQYAEEADRQYKDYEEYLRFGNI